MIIVFIILFSSCESDEKKQKNEKEIQELVQTYFDILESKQWSDSTLSELLALFTPEGGKEFLAGRDAQDVLRLHNQQWGDGKRKIKMGINTFPSESPLQLKASEESPEVYSAETTCHIKGEGIGIDFPEGKDFLQRSNFVFSLKKIDEQWKIDNIEESDSRKVALADTVGTFVNIVVAYFVPLWLLIAVLSWLLVNLMAWGSFNPTIGFDLGSFFIYSWYHPVWRLLWALAYAIITGVTLVKYLYPTGKAVLYSFMSFILVYVFISIIVGTIVLFSSGKKQ